MKIMVIDGNSILNRAFYGIRQLTNHEGLPKMCIRDRVYGDAEAASRLFDRLSRVCHAVTRRVDKGETLLEVFAA